MRLIQPKPLADQVEDLLRGRIRDGTFSPGSRIPSESELSAEIGVSRATVRTVLAKLAVNGLILRKQGDGTYVNARVQEVKAHLGNIWEFTHIIEANGYKPTIKSLSIEQKPASETEANSLAIEVGTEVLSLVRLFFADDQPVILSQNIIPISFLREPFEQLEGQFHIREILSRYCNQKIAFAITDIQSVLVSDDVADKLEKELEKSVLELQVAFYSKESLPLALGSNYFNDKALRLSLVQAWS